MNVTPMAIETPSTGATVVCSYPRFANGNDEDNPELITMDIDIAYNGLTGRLGDKVTFGRLATLTQKQAAVRNRVNQLLVAFEPGTAPLTNAAIQIVGLPV